jgi:hypothetical protein
LTFESGFLFHFSDPPRLFSADFEVNRRGLISTNLPKRTYWVIKTNQHRPWSRLQAAKGFAFTAFTAKRADMTDFTAE